MASNEIELLEGFEEMKKKHELDMSHLRLLQQRNHIVNIEQQIEFIEKFLTIND